MEEWKEEEIWKEVHGWPGYKVSTFGRVKRIYKNGNEIIRKPQMSNNGYLRVDLSNGKKQRKYLVHRLVAITFLPNFYGLPEVDHKIRNDKVNNNLYNLHWSTSKDNKKNRDDYRTDITATELKERRKICSKQSKQRIKDSGIHNCPICNQTFFDAGALEIHYTSQRHAKNLTRVKNETTK